MPLTIYTGGAKGVDTHVERVCHLYGHSCVVLIPPGHPRAKSLAPLTQPDLDAATPTVTQVAFRLGRHVSHPITLQYLQRNYYVIKPASLVLALGYFDELRQACVGRYGMECGHGSDIWQTPLCVLFGYGTMVLVESYPTTLSTL